MKETVNKTKRPPTEWEKVFANDKGLIPKIYKELIQLKSKTKHLSKNLTDQKSNGSNTVSTKSLNYALMAK